MKAVTHVLLQEVRVVEAAVTVFWAAQEFDLELPNVDGKTAHGNCTLCFLQEREDRRGAFEGRRVICGALPILTSPNG